MKIILYSSSVYSCHLFLISSASVRSVLIVPIFAWNVPLISLNFLEEISSLSHSVVFLYFFALVTEEGFLLPFLSLLFFGTLHWNGYLSFSPLPFTSLLFSAICKALSDNHFGFLHFFFLGMVLIPASYTVSQASFHSSSGTLSELIPWIYFSLPLYKGFDLGHTWMV